MIGVSDAYKEAALANARVAVGKLSVGSETLSEGDFQSFTITRSAGTDDVLTIGSVVSSYLTATIKKDALALYKHGIEIVPSVGFKIGNAEEFCRLGVMYIDDTQTERNGMFESIVAYDILANGVCDGTVPDSLWNSNSDSVVMATEIGKLIGGNNYALYIDVDSFKVDVSGTLEAYSPLGVNLPSGSTIRDALSLLGVACGGNVMTGSDGRIKLVHGSTDFSTAGKDISFNGSHIKKNGLSVQTKESSAITYIYTEEEIETETSEGYTEISKITHEFPDADSRVSGGVGILLNSELFYDTGNNSIEDTLSMLWTRFINNYGNYQENNFRCVKYQPFTLTAKGCPFIEPMDLIECLDYPTTDKLYLMPVTVVHKYNGSVTSMFNAAPQDESGQSVGEPSTVTISAINSDINPISAFVQQLIANKVTADKIIADSAQIGTITGTHGIIDYLESNFLSSDIAKISSATIEELFTKSGHFNAIEASTGTIFELSAVRIDGAYIVGGTVQADKLLITGEDGIVYELNKAILNENSDTFKEYEANAETDPSSDLKNHIHGSAIASQSITAEKINVEDLSALRATIGGLHIFDNGIRSSDASTLDTPAGIYLDKNGNFSVGKGEAAIIVDTDKNLIDMKVTTVKAQEDVQMGNYIWDVRDDPNTVGSQRLSLRWIGQ